MRGITQCSEFENFSDVQLLNAMLLNDNAHSCIYLRHKTYSLNWMMSKGASENDAEDIYQDATIVLYEKNQNPEFKLTCSIQTFLNSICYNQLRAKAKSTYNLKTVLTDDLDENLKDWFEEETEIINAQLERLLKEFEILKINGNKCYERLKLFYYDKLSMVEIASRLGFSNADSAKAQVNRCRGELKITLGL